MSGQKTCHRLHRQRCVAVPEMHDRDRDIGALPGCRPSVAWARHPRGSARTNEGTRNHMFPGKTLELRILQLYIWTLNAKRFIDGFRTATVARYGAYEVRLVETLLDPRGDTIPF